MTQAVATRDVSAPVDRLPDWEVVDAAPPFGSAGVAIDVAGVRVEIEGLSEEQGRWLRGRYGVFAREPGGEVALRLRCGRGPAVGFLQFGPHGEVYRFASEWAGRRCRAWSYRFAGWFSEEERDGRLVICDEAGWGFESSVENFLRAAYATMFLPRGGFLLHSAAIVRGGWAHLLFGPSGCGKTTASRASAGGVVLSDDLTLVVPGDDGGPRAASVPFRGHHAEVALAQGSWPVAGFFRLVKAPGERLERVGRALGMADILGSLPFVSDRAGVVPEAMRAVARALDGAPAFRLHLRRGPAYWEVIDSWRAGAELAGEVGRRG